ncbi:hypothetical protein DACRYDRAFT_116855 [Dacryopinax primogenitus]|uniref:Uncharacterized protein n=1 Tax=Dacryopinax primogenitus (strain DJM 731) TaxID=1858805 RepID=M5G5B2_DACPD|nr:uncharacterized protein DACRYDRAFT_116855 [Dacryopinax primogenitus]EJU01017.1 hypothetical protein DACRYDRAFT_116855 [Dacryopinax primogenitus]
MFHFWGSEVLLIADGLSYGSHTATFSVAITGSGQSLDFYGGVVTLSAGPAGTTIQPEQFIDNTSNRWEYQPFVWLEASALGDYGGTHSYACNYLEQVTAAIQFSGSSIIEIIGSPASNSFGYTVQFNNAETVYNATNFWWAQRQVMFFAGGLDPTQTYNLTLLDFDVNQPTGPPGLNTSGFWCVNLDAAVIVPVLLPANATSTSTSNGAGLGTTGPSGSNGLSSGAIAGIAIGIIFSTENTGHAVYSSSIDGSVNGPNMVQPPDPIPFVSPPSDPLTSAFASDAPISVVIGATSSSSFKAEMSTRSPYEKAGHTQIRQRRGGETSGGNDTRHAQEVLQNAPTDDLIAILNQRLRVDQADNLEEPPQYEN